MRAAGQRSDHDAQFCGLLHDSTGTYPGFGTLHNSAQREQRMYRTCAVRASCTTVLWLPHRFAGWRLEEQLTPTLDKARNRHWFGRGRF